MKVKTIEFIGDQEFIDKNIRGTSITPGAPK
jgi:hypothetical protein